MPQTTPEVFRFSEVTDPSDILVREHFEDLGKSAGMPNSTFTRAFHKIVDQGNYSSHNRICELQDVEIRIQRQDRVILAGSIAKMVQVREPTPLPGVELVKRSDVGIGPYDSKTNYRSYSLTPEAEILAGYGIVAGSVVEVLNPLRQMPGNIDALNQPILFEFMPNRTAQALGAIATRLAEQLQPS